MAVAWIQADDGVKQLLGMRKIIRPASGAPYLGKRKFKKFIKTTGRLADLLPIRTTANSTQVYS
jgi:hypothetical protein